jgi:hypothetical protein
MGWKIQDRMSVGLGRDAASNPFVRQFSHYKCVLEAACLLLRKVSKHSLCPWRDSHVLAEVAGAWRATCAVAVTSPGGASERSAAFDRRISRSICVGYWCIPSPSKTSRPKFVQQCYVATGFLKLASQLARHRSRHVSPSGALLRTIPGN